MTQEQKIDKAMARFWTLRGNVHGTDKAVVKVVAKAQRLNLDKLLSFDDADFGHDMSGIIQHGELSTGELKNCFWPRCGAC